MEVYRHKRRMHSGGWSNGDFFFIILASSGQRKDFRSRQVRWTRLVFLLKVSHEAAVMISKVQTKNQQLISEKRDVTFSPPL